MDALCPGENGFGQGLRWLRGDPPCSMGSDRVGEGLCPARGGKAVPGLWELARKPPRGPSGFLSPRSEVCTRCSRAKGNSRDTRFGSTGRCTPSLVCGAKPDGGLGAGTFLLPAAGRGTEGGRDRGEAGERPGSPLAALLSGRELLPELPRVCGGAGVGVSLDTARCWTTGKPGPAAGSGRRETGCL